jgi:hypothetical protein
VLQHTKEVHDHPHGQTQVSQELPRISQICPRAALWWHWTARVIHRSGHSCHPTSYETPEDPGSLRDGHLVALSSLKFSLSLSKPLLEFPYILAPDLEGHWYAWLCQFLASVGGSLIIADIPIPTSQWEGDFFLMDQAVTLDQWDDPTALRIWLISLWTTSSMTGSRACLS